VRPPNEGRRDAKEEFFGRGEGPKVSIEALRGLRTANEIAGEYDCHPAQVSMWKK
jgi:hypothetical protein